MQTIRNWVLATFILTFLVIIAGGVVRTTQSGMGCPDWPKCFGSWIPPTDASQLPPDFEKYLRRQDIDHSFNALHTWIEYINRLTGALLGLFAVIQFALLYTRRKEWSKAFRFALLYLVTIILTGLVGAIVVKLNLAYLSISVHMFFALILLQLQSALWLSVKEKQTIFRIDPAVKNVLLAFVFVLLLQVILGVKVRMYVDDVSKVLHYGQRETWLAGMPVFFLIHRSYSILVLIFAVFLTYQFRMNAFLKKQMYRINGVILLSILTGIVLFYLNMPAIAQPIHLFLANVLITLAVSILLRSTSTV